MKKSIVVFLVALLFLVGCADGNLSETSATKVAGTENENLKSAVSQFGESMAENDLENESTNVEKENSEESTNEQMPLPDMPNAYNIILNNIYSSLQIDYATEEVDNVHFSTGISEVVMPLGTVEERMKAIAFCIKDVNDDGVEELVIVDTSYPEPGNVRILDMYTLVEGTSVRVIEGWARNRFYLLDDGYFFSEGSGGAAYTNVELLRYPSGAVQLSSKELYFTYPKNDDMSDVGFYYSEDGVYDVSLAMEVSADDFEAFYNNCMSKIVEFDTYTFEVLK